MSVRRRARLVDTCYVAPIEEVRERLDIIEAAAQHSVGVNEYEHHLIDLLALLGSDRVPRETGVSALTLLATEWP